MGRWYEGGVRFSCLRCGRCCRGEGEVLCSEEEALAIASYLGVEGWELSLFFGRARGGLLRLKDSPRGDCIFYDPTSSSCRIYGVRPRQCRTFPFWPEALEREEVFRFYARTCPGVGSGRLFSAEEMEAVSRGDMEATDPPRRLGRP